MNIYIDLFLTFAKIGAMTFGGGYAMLPMLQRELVDKKKWVSEEELLDYFAIGQCTPGIIAVNTATFVGYKLKGNLAGIVASVGLVFPSVVIISIIAAVLTGFADIQAVKYAFAGIRVCVCVLITNAVIKLAKKSVKDLLAGAIFIAVALAASVLKVTPVVFVFIAAALGIGIQSIKGAGK